VSTWGLFRILKTWAPNPPFPEKEDNQNEIMFLYAIKLSYFYDHISPIHVCYAWKTILTLSQVILCHNHYFLCLTTYPHPFPERVHKTMRHGASAFDFHNRLVSFPSSRSCLRFLPRFPIPAIFPSMTCFRRQFLYQIWPRQLLFLRFKVKPPLQRQILDRGVVQSNS
jgi:hypothetical protein